MELWMPKIRGKLFGKVTRALLGAQFVVPAPENRATLKTPQGTITGCEIPFALLFEILSYQSMKKISELLEFRV